MQINNSVDLYEFHEENDRTVLLSKWIDESRKNRRRGQETCVLVAAQKCVQKVETVKMGVLGTEIVVGESVAVEVEGADEELNC